MFFLMDLNPQTTFWSYWLLELLEATKLFLAKPSPPPAAASVEDALACILIRTVRYLIIKSEDPVDKGGSKFRMYIWPKP